MNERECEDLFGVVETVHPTKVMLKSQYYEERKVRYQERYRENLERFAVPLRRIHPMKEFGTQEPDDGPEGSLNRRLVQLLAVPVHPLRAKASQMKSCLKLKQQIALEVDQSQRIG